MLVLRLMHAVYHSWSLRCSAVQPDCTLTQSKCDLIVAQMYKSNVNKCHFCAEITWNFLLLCWTQLDVCAVQNEYGKYDWFLFILTQLTLWKSACVQALKNPFRFSVINGFHGSRVYVFFSFCSFPKPLMWHQYHSQNAEYLWSVQDKNGDLFYPR